MTIGFCTNRKFLTLQVKKHEFTPVLPDFLIKCTKPHTRCRTIVSCGLFILNTFYYFSYLALFSHAIQSRGSRVLKLIISTLCNLLFAYYLPHDAIVRQRGL